MTEKEKLIKAVDGFALAMKSRLIEKIAVGKTGWDKKENYDFILADLAHDCFELWDCWDLHPKPLENNLLLDVANRAMMLFLLTDKPNQEALKEEQSKSTFPVPIDKVWQGKSGRGI